MTDPRPTTAFETRFADRVRAYTDAAAERPIDAAAVSHAAISSRRTMGRPGRLGADLGGRKIAGIPWAAAAVVLIFVGVVGIGVLGTRPDRGVGPQPSASASSPSPSATAGGSIDALRGSWERPTAVTPGLDRWPSATLGVTGTTLDVGPDPAALSTSEITGAGPDTISVTATAGTVGCAAGEVGMYHWSVEGKGTVLTLTAIGTDACRSREAALAGRWVEVQAPFPVGADAMLEPGTHRTSDFEPFGAPSRSAELSYDVPAGWQVIEDQPSAFVLHRPLDPALNQPFNGSFIFSLSDPRLAAPFPDGTTCPPFVEAPGARHGSDDLLAAILARPGVLATPPTAVTIGGYQGRMVDLRIDPAWTGGCVGPDGKVIVVPILIGEDGSGTGPSLAVNREMPLRVLLLDLPNGRTMAIAIVDHDPSNAASFDEHIAAATQIVESFELHSPT